MPAKPARNPTSLATAPTIGPRIAPRTAIPKTVPSSWPRSARGVDTVIQESAPAQVSALERPWRNRAMPTVSGESASASPKVANASSSSPLMTAFFGPTRPATMPPGMPPRTAPAPKAPTSSPAWSLLRSKSSTYAGTSGISAPNSMASRKTIALMTATRRRIADSLCRPLGPRSRRARRPSGPQKMHRAGCPFVRLPD